MIKDKVVIITGASSGIGEATAKLLASKGAQVVVGARREQHSNKRSLTLLAILRVLLTTVWRPKLRAVLITQGGTVCHTF